jgi:hypothetical protein
MGPIARERAIGPIAFRTWGSEGVLVAPDAQKGSWGSEGVLVAPDAQKCVLRGLDVVGVSCVFVVVLARFVYMWGFKEIRKVT